MKKIYMTIGVIFILIVLILGSIVFLPLLVLPKIVPDQLRQGVVFSENGELYTQDNSNTESRYEYQLINYDLINPKVAFILDSGESIFFRIFEMNRSDLISYGYSTYSFGRIYERNFEDSIKIISYPNFSTLENVVIRKAPTKEEVTKQNKTTSQNSAKEWFLEEYLRGLYHPDNSIDQKRERIPSLLNIYTQAATDLQENGMANVQGYECTREIIETSPDIFICQIERRLEELNDGLELVNKGEDPFIGTETFNEYLFDSPETLITIVTGDTTQFDNRKIVDLKGEWWEEYYVYETEIIEIEDPFEFYDASPSSK